MNPLFQLQDKVAIVTGGTGVLGSQMAKGLAQAGAKVAVLGRREEKAQEIAQGITSEGGQATATPGDVLDESSLKTAEKAILAEYGKIDILVNCAGGNMKGATIGPDQTFFDLDMSDFDKVVALNMKGTVLPTKVFAQNMAQNQSGSVINISSMAAFDRTITRVMGYSSSKAAISNFTHWLSVEMAKKFGEGIRVNAIAPGFFIGEQNRSLLLNEDGSLTDRGQTIIDHTPMGRFGESEELIGTLVYLCSEASQFVTGVVIPVDGGFSSFSGV